MFKKWFSLTTIICDYNFVNDFRKELLIWHFVKTYSFVRFKPNTKQMPGRLSKHMIALVSTLKSAKFIIDIFTLTNVSIQYWDNTVRRKCEYWVFQITNAKNLVKSRVEDKWFVKNFWHEWFGKPHTHISDLTVLTLLKTTNMHEMRKNLWNCSKVFSKTHIHTLHFTKCWVKLMYPLYILQSVE